MIVVHDRIPDRVRVVVHDHVRIVHVRVIRVHRVTAVAVPNPRPIVAVAIVNRQSIQFHVHDHVPVQRKEMVMTVIKQKETKMTSI